MITVGRPFGSFHVLALAAVVAPTLALYAPLGLAPLFMLAGVTALALDWRRQPWRTVPREAALALVALAGWLMVSTLWAIEPPVALRTGLGLIGLFAGGLMLVGLTRSFETEQRRQFGLILAAGLTIALIMAASELYLHWPMAYFTRSPDPNAIPFSRRMGRGLTVVAILMIPVATLVWRSGRRAWAVAILVLAAADIVHGETLSAKISLVAAPAAYFAVCRIRRIALPVIFGVAVALVLAFPALSLVPSPQRTMDALSGLIPNSSHHRLTIWTFTAGKALEHPLRGWGLEASRSLPGAEDTVNVYKTVGDARVLIVEQFLPLHPHNGPGQIWLELGGVGAVLICLLIAALARAVSRIENRFDAGMTAAAFTSTVVVACVSYGTWQSWWQGVLWLTAAFLSAASASSPADGADHA